MKRIEITKNYYVEIDECSEIYYRNGNKYLEIYKSLNETRLIINDKEYTIDKGRIIKYHDLANLILYDTWGWTKNELNSLGYRYSVICNDDTPVEHNYDGPSKYERFNNYEYELYRQLDTFHRIDGMAYKKNTYDNDILIHSEYKYYYCGLIYREDGPAIIEISDGSRPGTRETYVIYDYIVSKQEFYCYQLNKILPENISVYYGREAADRVYMYELRIDNYRQGYFTADKIGMELLEKNIKHLMGVYV